MLKLREPICATSIRPGGGGRRPVGRSLVIATLFAGSLLGVAGTEARAAPDSFADLAEKLLPAVVNISTTQNQDVAGRPGPEMPQLPPGSPFEDFFKEFFDRNRPEGPMRRSTSLGSGFIIDSRGYVVTNNHVIADADEIKVILQDGTRLDATVRGRDTKTDHALLKVKADKPLPTVSWGDSDKVRVGDWVMAIGNPFGLGGSVTTGILSARQRDINAGPYDDFLQTDASINRGNSGGPLFNMAGEVIGINTAIISPQGGSVGIGFAVPSSMARTVISQLMEFGRTRRGWLGVRIQTVDEEIAESVGLNEARGALVVNVTENGPAAKAGIQARDIIISFDGKDVDAMRKLPRIVAETAVGKTVPVVVWRRGKEMSFDVKLGELEVAEQTEQASATTGPGNSGPENSRPGTTSALGLTLSTIDADLRRRFDLTDDTQGVLVTGVANDSAAAEKGIRPGDVVVEAGQDKVTRPEQIKAKVDEARKAGRKSLLLLVKRKEDLRFIALRIDQG
ncbi:MAG TPA: DegQ family serine endoprotease [Alphaproteobacteria bacterium]